MTDREILDALHNVRELCIPGVNWTDDIARLALAEFDRAVPGIRAVIKARDTLLDACRTEREELAVDQAGSRSPDIQKHLGNRIAWLDSVIALAHEGHSSRKGRKDQATMLMLSIAIKLYARAARISWDEAEDNVKDAVLNTIEEKAGREPDEATEGGSEP